mgnify:CR=1 FL=1
MKLSNELVTDSLIVPVLNFDDGDRIVEGHEIDLASYTEAPFHITLTPYTFNADVHGNKNFCFELHFRGSALVGVSMPIIIELETESQG